MTLVTVKTKYQVTLPASIRKQAGLAVGDILEAKVVGKEITLSPKSVIDRDLALALEDVRKGRTHGPFNSAEEAIAFLHRSVRGLRRKRARKAS
jgi:AbrB family looped-hinge helix DNA binding protein